MSAEKIDKLTALVSSVVQELHALKSENAKLDARIRELEDEKEEILDRNQSVETRLRDLELLKNQNRRMEEEKKLVRSKVQGLLDELEKLEF